ncbi:SH3 domain-containing protein 2 [Tanacetum coccineum]
MTTREPRSEGAPLRAVVAFSSLFGGPCHQSNGNPENLSKFEAAQARLKELKSNMTILGKEAVATMSAVEAQQQRLTLQRLIAMVEAEKNHHQKVLHILDRLEGEDSVELLIGSTKYVNYDYENKVVTPII